MGQVFHTENTDQTSSGSIPGLGNLFCFSFFDLFEGCNRFDDVPKRFLWSNYPQKTLEQVDGPPNNKSNHPRTTCCDNIKPSQATLQVGLSLSPRTTEMMLTHAESKPKLKPKPKIKKKLKRYDPEPTAVHSSPQR